MAEANLLGDSDKTVEPLEGYKGSSQYLKRDLSTRLIIGEVWQYDSAMAIPPKAQKRLTNVVIVNTSQDSTDLPRHPPTASPPWHCVPAALAPTSSYYWPVAPAAPPQMLSTTNKEQGSVGLPGVGGSW